MAFQCFPLSEHPLAGRKAYLMDDRHVDAVPGRCIPFADGGMAGHTVYLPKTEEGKRLTETIILYMFILYKTIHHSLFANSSLFCIGSQFVI